MFKNILVAVDGSLPSDKSIETACDIGTMYNARLYIVHVIEDIIIPESTGLVGYMNSGKTSEASVYMQLQLMGDEILSRSERIARKCGMSEIETAILHGKPAGKIVEFAKEGNVDLIILGSHGLGNIGALLMGSVSGKVCHLAECTCMIVR